jgi:hypothetical protein
LCSYHFEFRGRKISAINVGPPTPDVDTFVSRSGGKGDGILNGVVNENRTCYAQFHAHVLRKKGKSLEGIQMVSGISTAVRVQLKYWIS